MADGPYYPWPSLDPWTEIVNVNWGVHPITKLDFVNDRYMVKGKDQRLAHVVNHPEYRPGAASPTDAERGAPSDGLDLRGRTGGGEPTLLAQPRLARLINKTFPVTVAAPGALNEFAYLDHTVVLEVDWFDRAAAVDADSAGEFSAAWEAGFFGWDQFESLFANYFIQAGGGPGCGLQQAMEKKFVPPAGFELRVSTEDYDTWTNSGLGELVAYPFVPGGEYGLRWQFYTDIDGNQWAWSSPTPDDPPGGWHTQGWDRSFFTKYGVVTTGASPNDATTMTYFDSPAYNPGRIFFLGDEPPWTTMPYPPSSVFVYAGSDVIIGLGTYDDVSHDVFRSRPALGAYTASAGGVDNATYVATPGSQFLPGYQDMMFGGQPIEFGRLRIAMTFRQNELSLSINGGAVVTTAAPQAFAPMPRVPFAPESTVPPERKGFPAWTGLDATESIDVEMNFSGFVRCIWLYRKAKTPARLQALSAIRPLPAADDPHWKTG